MKVVHVGGGLGNQLADYFNYLLVKRSNPADDIYIETLIYDIPEAHEKVCQWNGYELDRIFHLNLPNIRNLFTEEEYGNMVRELKETQFWIDGWRPRNAILEVLNKHGCSLQVVGRPDQIREESGSKKLYRIFRRYLTEQSGNYASYLLKKIVISVRNSFRHDRGSEIYAEREGNYYYTPTFACIKSKKMMEIAGDEFVRTLHFPPFADEKNMKMQKIIAGSNSVSIHARRSDYLKYNEDCYKYGYFKRAVRYMKKNIENPVFIIFSEECSWCREHPEVLGIGPSDTFYFVDWNRGPESYKDLQLMSLCKNNIITKSSFGYLACLLNGNESGITCSQMSDYLTTKHF